MNPTYDENNPIPYCNDEQCGSFDGKRCSKLGYRPSRVCEPALKLALEPLKMAHVICANDSTEAVCIGTIEEASKVKERLEKEDFGRNSSIDPGCSFFWHIHENVPVLSE